jgi:hypothetical protein
MSFSKEFFRGISQEFISPFNFTVTLINGSAIYVDGFEKILSISSVEVTLKTKKHCLKIRGEELRIEKMEEFSCVIVGDIGEFIVD